MMKIDTSKMSKKEVEFVSNIRLIGASEDECWEWGIGLTYYGYGRFTINGKRQFAHRISYELFVGKIPEGLFIDHLCRNRDCVNPTHLEPVTLKENLLRGEGFSVTRKAQTHCIKGHELSGRNLKIRKNGTRFCRECDKIRAREKRSRC